MVSVVYLSLPSGEQKTNCLSLLVVHRANLLIIVKYREDISFLEEILEVVFPVF